MKRLAPPNPNLPHYEPRRGRRQASPDWLDFMRGITEAHRELSQMEESFVGGASTEGGEESSEEDPHA